MEAISAEEVDAAVIANLRELLVPYTTETRELARKMTARLRHAGLLRMAVTKTVRPSIQFEPD